jgi:LacI family transcriptional regulator
VLNGSSRVVNEQLRARVMAAAAELRYVPNAHAQALVRDSTNIVGVIVHDVADPYFAEISRGIQDAASQAERLVLVCNSYREPQRELEYVRLLQMQRVEAIIMTGSGLDDERYNCELASQLDAFTATGGSVAVIGRHQVHARAVLPANAAGSLAMAHALWNLGHRHFAVITGPAMLTSTRDRLEGFRQGLAEHGLSLAPDAIAEGHFTREGGAQAALALLEQHPDITAIYALNDVMAIGVLGALRARGIAVPEQISVVGYDDIPIASDVFPALTTVHVPMQALGAQALRFALSQDDEPGSIILPTEVVMRASTAAPRAPK